MTRLREAVAVVFLMALAGCSDQATPDAAPPGTTKADLLYQCDSARKERAQLIDPALRSDPTFRYELSLKPLTEITASFEYQTGVINATGNTDGVKWTCLVDPIRNSAQWGFDDDQTGP